MTTRGTGASDFAFFSSGPFSELSADFGTVFLFLGGIFVSIDEIYSRENGVQVRNSMWVINLLIKGERLRCEIFLERAR